MKALIADDEKPVRDCIQLLVDWSQYGISQVFEAEDGREAIQVIRGQGPMIVLMDIMMPLTGGLQLMEWIHSYASECRVIAISGYTDYDYVRQIFIQGGIDYIRKPIQPQKLYDALAKASSELKNSIKGREEPDEEAGAFRQIKDYIDKHYQEELSLKQIAASFHFSESHLSRKFKLLYDINLVQYIKAVRIQHAKKYLLHSQKKLSEIASLVGYEDEKYFIRVFKELEKTTPAAYRKMNVPG